MSRYSLTHCALAVALVASGFSFQSALAQDDEAIEEVVTIGSRNAAKPRSASDSTVPIDVIDGDQFDALGSTADLTDNLKAVVPSYTATPATGDGSAFVRPTSLRGTAPDQMLVLINGKRRHRSALVHFFAPAAGNGAHGPDVGMIPSMAIKRVEVLRDGASSQYGSDAIAGVLNFVMRDDSEGGKMMVQFGQHYEGEDSLKIGGNYRSSGWYDSGFVNTSFEYVDNDALSRGVQRPDAQALIDGGTPGVGARMHRSVTHRSYRRGVVLRLKDFRCLRKLWLRDLNGNAELYARFGYADTDGRYRFFYRSPIALNVHIAAHLW